MHNLRKIVIILGAMGFILACSFAATPVSQPADVSTIVASTLQALTSTVPASTQPALQGVAVSYMNVSFVIPPEIAAGASSQTIPAADEQNGGPWGAAPQHIEFTFTKYGLPAGSFSQILLDVYPAQDYANANAGAKISLPRLQAVLSNPSAPLSNDTLPQVPYFNAASMLTAQIKLIKFQTGSGVRMITQYGQAVGPITNNGTFYHFEGLTNDGKYYIIAVLPIQAPFLENGNDPSAPLPAGGIPFPGYDNTDPSIFDSYYKTVADKLNSTQADAFTPPLSSLDSLIQSITVNQ